VSITAAGRQVVDQATQRRRALIAGILARLPAGEQSAVAAALSAFAAAAGEVPDDQWPALADVPAPPLGGAGEAVGTAKQDRAGARSRA
jgi:hypothetical protein